MSLYASWVHGNSVLLERYMAPEAKDKRGVRRSFKRKHGDIVALPNDSAAACLRLGWAARFVVFSTLGDDFPGGGEFWCHYAVPTPVVEAGQRAEAASVLVNYESSDISAVSLAAIHVWDGNRRIFADDSPVISGDDFNGGIRGFELSANVTPDVEKLWKRNIDRTAIYFGLSVSILVRARTVRDDYLEIRGVGIDFRIES